LVFACVVFAIVITSKGDFTTCKYILCHGITVFITEYLLRCFVGVSNAPAIKFGNCGKIKNGSVSVVGCALFLRARTKNKKILKICEKKSE